MFREYNVFNYESQRGIQTKPRRKHKKGIKQRIPYHGRRRHMNLPVMGGTSNCVHSLSAHEDILTAAKDGTDSITISYALPCAVKHKSTTKNPSHRDATGRKWK